MTHFPRPRSKKDLFIANGGRFACIVCAICVLVALRALFNGDVRILGLAAMGGMAGAALIWRANRMALDARIARESGNELKATVLAVQYIAQDSGWATMFPRARLVWRDENHATGQSTLHPYHYVSQWSRGDEITVYRGTLSTWWEGDVGSRVTSRSQIPTGLAHPAE